MAAGVGLSEHRVAALGDECGRGGFTHRSGVRRMAGLRDGDEIPSVEIARGGVK